MKLGIVNYNCGNVKSLFNAFLHLNSEPFFINSPLDFEKATHLALPGVGSFKYCMTNLLKSGLADALENHVLVRKKPVIGICVGMQLLFKSSEEDGVNQGLGWFSGKITKLNRLDGMKIPHVGWNSASFVQDFGKFKSNQEYDFYFDHSFALMESDICLSSSSHSQNFVSSIKYENILACQFHPEKSQTNGLNFLRSFLDLNNHA